ncbi:hypothetical protein ABZ023_18765 [Streptomyces sp. NPDC006367]|uniref:hypothetical protein n=1 Tax=unclassified Streptomyces TaxID=2593676 RepID=UPI0033A1AE34
MSIYAITRSSARHSGAGPAASDSAPPSALSFPSPLNAAAARVRTAPTGTREQAYGHLLNRLDESARFTAAAEAEETETLLEDVLGQAAAPDQAQIAAWTPRLEAVLRILCENSGRIVQRYGPDANAAVQHGLTLLQDVRAAAPDLGRLRRLAHAVSAILDLAGDAP